MGVGQQEVSVGQQEAGVSQQEVGVGEQEAGVGRDEVIDDHEGEEDPEMDPDAADRTNKVEDGEMITKSGREVKKSRIILEEEDYKRGVAHANELTDARRQLRQDWKDFEVAHPRSYVRHWLELLLFPAD